ncbi:MAG TPA: S4 domain-containing protein, partial [Chryseosolibacter sp.]|nr:S4 domain-containing protein [Chryseosolibacter sp.]
ANFIRIFTLFSREEIDGWIAEHTAAPHLRKLQQILARDITTRVHGKTEFENAVKASNILFGQSTTEDLQGISEATLLSVFEGVPQRTISKDAFKAVSNVTDLLSVATDGLVFPSKGEARKMIQGGGVSINKIRVDDPNQKVDFNLLQNKYLLAQKGKKNYYLIVIE